MAAAKPKSRRTVYLVGGAVVALLAFLWWRRRSSTGTAIRTTDSGPPAGLQPLATGAAFGSPLMSPSAVSTPSIGSPTVGGAGRVATGVAGDARTGGPPHTEPPGTILGYGETTYAADLATLKARQPSWGVPSGGGGGTFRVVYRVGANGFKDTVWERV